MRYDRYTKKIQFLNAVVNKIYQMRIFFITITASIVASILSYNSVKGSIQFVSEQKTVFTYGEEYSFSSFALFNDCFIEYSKKDENSWSSVAPTLVGQYQVRGSSFNGYKQKTHSEPVDFVIEPRKAEVYVNKGQINYGEIPEVSAHLFGTDKLGSDYKVIYDDPYSLNTKVQPDLDSIHIFDENNNDITYCYELNSIKKDINIIPRKITVSFDNFSKTYDGEDYTFSEGHLIGDDPLLPGDEIQYLTSNLVLPESGVYEDFEYFRPVKITHDGHDVTVFYNITFKKGKLTVKKRDITFSSPVYSGVYNGKTLEENGVFGDLTVSANQLLEGNIVEFTYDNEETLKNDFVTIEGGFTNSFTVKIYKDETKTKEITNCYSITKNENKIEVSKQDIEITLGSDSKVYDSTPLSKKTFTYDEDKLINGDTITVNEDLFPSLNTVDEISNFDVDDVDNFVSIKSNGDNRNGCYNISVVPGTLSVTKRPLKINMLKYEGVYNGVYNVIDNFVIDPNNTDEVLQNFTISLKKAPRTAKNAGVYESTGEENIKVSLNDVDVTDCFDITCIKATSTIFKKEIKPRFYFDNDETKDQVTYDGTDHVVSVKFSNDAKPVDGDDVCFVNDKNELSETTKKRYYTENGYDYSSLGFDIRNGDDSVLSNYSIIGDNKLTIKKADLSLSLPEFTSEYDGEKHIVTIPKESKTSQGDKITLNTNYKEEDATLLNAGDEYVFNKNMYSVENESNYNITYNKDSATSKITKKVVPVTISTSTDNAEFIYDGNEHEFDININSSYLFSDSTSTHELKDTKIKIKNSGEYNKEFFESKIKIVDSKNNNLDVTGNYDFDVTCLDKSNAEFEKINIKKFPLKVTFKRPDVDPVYTGEEFVFNNYEKQPSSNYPTGEKPIITNEFKATKAGTYKWNDISKPEVKIVKDDGTDKIEADSWKNNYDITIVPWSSDIVIKKKNLKIVYDDNLSFEFQNKTLQELYEEKYTKNESIKIFDGSVDVTNQYNFDLDFKEIADSKFIETKCKLQEFVGVKIFGKENEDITSNFEFDVGAEKTIVSTPVNAYLKVDKTIFKDTYNRGTILSTPNMGLGKSSSPGLLSYNKGTVGSETYEFWEKYYISVDKDKAKDCVTIKNNPFFAGSYDININTEGFSLITRDDENPEVIPTNCYKICFDSLSNAYTINKKALTITAKDIILEEGETAPEGFFITGDLCPNDILYLINPYLNVPPEEVFNGYKEGGYDSIIDINYDDDDADFLYSVLDDEGNHQPVGVECFEVYTYLDVDDDGDLEFVATHSYAITYKLGMIM